MAFKNYAQFAEPLILPIGDKSYTIPALGIADGIKFNGILGTESIESMTDDEFRRCFLGAALDEMIADNVPAQAVTRAAMTALADYQRGRDVAEVMWETGGDPKALTRYANRAQRRSTSTGGAKKTPSQASTKATTSPTN